MLQLLNNDVLLWGLLSCGIAQFLKIFVDLFKNRQLRFSILFETGGMPSSHSSLVTATAAGIGWKLGFDDPLFTLSVAIAFIVMYDASGIRRSAGIQAKQINFLSENSKNNKNFNRLKEELGHTKLEVLVGSLLGPLIALPGIIYFGSPIQIAYKLQNLLA
tara:strand:+ start:10979 stop:11461 length:483 start_codon:yes stop_codon:yes gene_type:complete